MLLAEEFLFQLGEEALFLVWLYLRRFRF